MIAPLASLNNKVYSTLVGGCDPNRLADAWKDPLVDSSKNPKHEKDDVEMQVMRDGFKVDNSI